MEPDRDIWRVIDRLDTASDQFTELTLTGNEARALNNYINALAQASQSKDLMAAALHEATDRANRMERQYLDIESGSVHFDLDAAREQLADVRAEAAATLARREDVIAELRLQLDRQLKYRKKDLAAITRVRAVADAMDAEAEQYHGGLVDGLREASNRIYAALRGEVPNGD